MNREELRERVEWAIWSDIPMGLTIAKSYSRAVLAALEPELRRLEELEEKERQMIDALERHGP